MTNSTNDQINIEEFVNKINGNLNIFTTFDISFAFLGGSQATEEAQWWSDIDIFVSLKNHKEISDENKFDLTVNLEQSIAKLIQRDVEVNLIDNLPAKVRFSVLKNGLVLFGEDSGWFYEFKAQTIRDYIEYKLWIDSFYKYQLEALS